MYCPAFTGAMAHTFLYFPGRRRWQFEWDSRGGVPWEQYVATTTKEFLPQHKRALLLDRMTKEQRERGVEHHVSGGRVLYFLCSFLWAAVGAGGGQWLD